MLLYDEQQELGEVKMLVRGLDLMPPSGMFRIIRVYVPEETMSLTEEVVGDRDTLDEAKLEVWGNVPNNTYHLIYDSSGGFPVWETPGGEDRVFKLIYPS